jgi:hypothetical protein
LLRRDAQAANERTVGIDLAPDRAAVSAGKPNTGSAARFVKSAHVGFPQDAADFPIRRSKPTTEGRRSRADPAKLFN